MTNGIIKVTVPYQVIKNKPILYLEKMYGIGALLDTGASIPIWTADEAELVALGAIKVSSDQYSFKVFGGTECTGVLYTIPSFVIGDNLFYPNMPIVACKYDHLLQSSVLLPFSMFANLKMEIDDVTKEITISVPVNQQSRRLKIEDEDGDIHILLVEDVL